MKNKIIKSLKQALLIAPICLSQHSLADESASSDVEWFGELLLRQEQTTGLPNNREDLERTRLFLWAGFETSINSQFSFGASIVANTGSDKAEDNRSNLDNSETDTLEIDQFFIKWQHSESGSTWIGKQYLPIKLSTMIWDKDIYTLGVSSVNEWRYEDDAEYLMAFGAHRVEHIFSDQSQLAYAKFQYGQYLGETFISSAFSLVMIDDTDTLLTDNVRRTNSDAALLEGFEIGLIEIKANFSLGDVSVKLGLESLKNFAMDEENVANRVDLSFGDSSVKNGWQTSFHYQDVERDAVVAAFNDDDWWFATRMKGYRVSGSFGLSNDTAVQLSYFDEELAAENTKRLFLEITAIF